MNRGQVLALGGLLALASSSRAEPAPSANGAEVMQRFKAHLASPECHDASSTWQRHYAPIVRSLAVPDSPTLARFDYVLSRLIDAGLPAEYATIPFVESHYEPTRRSGLGPSGLWQFTARTARAHGLRVGGDNDERLSMEASTRAAVRYLRTLHHQFGGNWRHTVMAYNAGDGRMRQSLRRGGTGLGFVTRVYPEKMHAIACDVVQQAGSERWKTPMKRALPGLRLPKVLQERRPPGR